MPFKNRLWLKSLLLVVPLVMLAALTLLFMLGQANRVRLDQGHLEDELARTLQAELAGRSLITEVKEYADSLLGDEDVQQEITQVRRQTRHAFDAWKSLIRPGEESEVADLLENLSLEYDELQVKVESVLARWDQGENEAAHRLIRQGILRQSVPRLLQLINVTLLAQEMALHGALEALRSESQFGLLPWLGAEKLLRRTTPRLQTMNRALEFSRHFYAELLGYARFLLTPELVGQRRLQQSRSRADRSLERWRTYLGDHSDEASTAKRRQFEKLRQDVARVRESANEILNSARVDSEAEAMEFLEDQVEAFTRDNLLPAIDAMVFEEEQAVASEMQALNRLTRKVVITAYGLSGLILLMCLGALIFLRHSILRPINELRRGIELFRDGEENVRVAVRSNDELGLVSSEFNTMAQDLTQYRKALEERTREAETARRQAEIASHIKSEFLANMSHEFRTPINGLVGCIDILSGTDLEPEQRQYCEILHQSTNSLLAVVEDVMDASQLLTGQIRIESSHFELPQTVTQIVELLRPRAREKGLDLTLHLNDVPTFVTGDPGRLRQVLLHLIGNALKFTEQGGVTVVVGCESQDAETVRLRIDVQDTGIGIDQDQHGLIFEPFTQVDPSITRKYGGTGLGLSISRQLVELMGGSLKVKSRAGEGSTFTLQLDLAAH